VRDAFSFAFDRPRAALGRRLQIRRVSAAPRERSGGSSRRVLLQTVLAYYASWRH